MTQPTVISSVQYGVFRRDNLFTEEAAALQNKLYTSEADADKARRDLLEELPHYMTNKIEVREIVPNPGYIE